MSFYTNGTSLNAINFNNLGVSSVYYNNVLVWGEASTLPVGHLEFNSPEPFSIVVYYPNWNGLMEYSTDAITWETWDGRSIKANYTYDNRYKLYFRGTENTRVTGTSSSYGANFEKDYCWTIVGENVSCVGSIENLLDYQAVQRLEHPKMNSSCFSAMFYGCSALVVPPELPAVKVASYCYDSMFMNCSNLISAPALPTTDFGVKTLAPGVAYYEYCYNNMFLGCSSLVEAPELPATTLSQGCYSAMFKGCVSLTKAPKLPAKTVRHESYAGMFYGCSKLTEIPILPGGVSLIGRSCANMFRDCISLKFSTVQSEECPNTYDIYGYDDTPVDWPDSTKGPTRNMFAGTSGDFTGTPALRTTYYTNATTI